MDARQVAEVAGKISDAAVKLYTMAIERGQSRINPAGTPDALLAGQIINLATDLRRDADALHLADVINNGT